MSPREKSAVRRPAPQTRVRWWAVAMPVTAFAVLLSLIAFPTAQAAGSAGHPAGSLFQAVVGALPRILLGLLG